VATLVALTYAFSGRSEKMEMLWGWTAGDLEVTTQSIESEPLICSGDPGKKTFRAPWKLLRASNHLDDPFVQSAWNSTSKRCVMFLEECLGADDWRPIACAIDREGEW
jgi:hypothetical protein